MSYCMYLRKSRKDLEAEMQGAGETLARHRTVLDDLAARRGYDIGKVYTEVVSADTISGRPVVQQLLADVQAGLWEGVLVYDIARLARGDTMDQGAISMAFRYSSPPTLIITPDRVYDPANGSDEEYLDFGLFFARREYKAITRRMQAGRESSAHEGKYAGSVHPYGYERYKLPGEKGWSLRIVPHEAEFVRLMYQWMVYGRDIVVDGVTVHETMGAAKTADALNALGSRTKRGNLWTPSSVRGIIHNPNYSGHVQWYKREKKVQLVDGKRVTKRPLSNRHIVEPARHEAIVTQELWDAAQAATVGRNRCSVKKSSRMSNPLAGFVKCSECGKAMVRTPMYGHLAGVDYLKCSTPRCPTSACPLSDVESMILESLRAWVVSAESAVPDPQPAHDDASTLRASVQARIDDLLKRRDRLMDLLETGVYDTSTYSQRMAILKRELDAAEQSLADLPEHIPTMQERLIRLLPALRHVIQVYDAAATPEDKNRLLRSVVDHVVYHKTHICHRNERPSDFVTLDVYPLD